MLHRKLALITVAAAWACDAEQSPTGDVVRETLPNGAVHLVYSGLPAPDATGPEVAEARVDLTIGSVDGDDPNFIFGDIRGIEAGSDGTIYVLDYQASEVRAFAPDGRFLRRVASKGEGPGEITEANGIYLAGDSILWLNDHGKMYIIGVTPAGDELHRFPLPVRAYGYIWRGTFDHRGRFWMATSHSDEQPAFPPEPGLSTRTARSYYKWYDLSTEATDSVYLGESTGRSYISESPGGGWSYRGIPFESSSSVLVDPAGGFWRANTASYRIVRTGEGGDTLVVIEAALPVQRVTGEDRSAFVEGVVDRDPDDRRTAEAIAALMPEVKPIISGFFVDDEGRLWVDRVTEEGAPAFYDLFSDDGDYLGSVRFAFEAAPYSKLWVYHGNIYTWVVDELDVPYVVRAPLPQLR